MENKYIVSKKEIKDYLANTFTNYFGQEFSEIISERLNSSELIFFNTFESVKNVDKFNKIHNILYLSEVHRLKNKLIRKFKQKNLNYKKNDINKFIKSEVMTIGTGAVTISFPRLSFNKETEKYETSRLIKIFMQKGIENEYDAILYHEHLHVISSYEKFLINTKDNFSYTINTGFKSIKHTSKYNKDTEQWIESRSPIRGTGLNEYLTEKIARDIFKKQYKNGYTFSKISQEAGKSTYMTMDSIGKDLFDNFGKELYKYAMTGDSKYVSSFINYDELEEIIDKFDYFYKNYKNIVINRHEPNEEYINNREKFEYSNMQLQSLINKIITRNKNKEEEFIL